MENVSLELKRVIKAPIERVFKAWIDPEELKQWHCPDGLSVPSVTSDQVAGGNYSITMQPPQGEAMVVMGRYKEIDPPHKLVFSWEWQGSSNPETQVTVLLKELGENQTELTLLHEHFVSQEDKKNHSDGWEDALTKLDHHLSAE